MKKKTMYKKIMGIMMGALVVVSVTGCTMPLSGNTVVSDSDTESADPDDTETKEAEESDSDDQTALSENLVGEYSDKEINAEWSDSEKDSTFITLSQSGASASGCESDSVKIQDENGAETICISEGGTYVLSGEESECRIVIDTDDDDNVQLVLSGVVFDCSSASPIECSSAKNLYITAVDGTENTISDNRTGESEEEDEDDISAAVYSKCDLIINGSGTLNINASYKDAVNTRDKFKYISGILNIDAADDGIVGKDSVSIRDGSITVNCTDDALKSNNSDEDKGYIVIDGGELVINTDNGHGFTAKNEIVINGGTVDVQQSYEGMESCNIVINDGTVNITSRDDGINISDSDSTSSQDDWGGFMQQGGNMPDMDTAFDGEMPDGQAPSDGEMPDMQAPSDGEMPGGHAPSDGENSDRSASEDGEISDNSTSADTKDNGHKDFGGKSGGSGGGFGGMMMDGDGIDGTLTINGGTITIDAGGDGLDSNGDIEITGGYTVVSGSTDGGNGALDYATGCTMTGGVLILSGNSGMASYPTSTTGVTMVNANTGSNLEAGTEVSLTDSSGNVLYTWTVAKECNYLQVAAPDIDEASEYSFITSDGEYDATTEQAAGMGGGFR